MDLNNVYVADLEGNGLLDKITRLHCAVFKNMQTGIWYKFTRDQKKELQDFLDQGMTLIMHNGIQFDRPALNKLGVKCNNPIIDTLLLSWYLEPERPKHGLESYGKQFGVPKPPVYDWDNEPMEVYIHRCTEDVKIQEEVWLHQLAKLKEIYSGQSAKTLQPFLEYIEMRGYILYLKSLNRWKLDVPAAHALYDKICKESELKTIELSQVMPKKPVYKTKNRPKVYFKKNGDLSKAGEEWEAFCEEQGINPDTPSHKYIASYKDPQPHYVPEVKEWLFSLGWEPETFEFKRNKDTGEIKQIPQVTVKFTGGEICPSIERMAKKIPELQALVGYSLLNHRKGFVKAMIDCADEDGYLQATVQGFTNTLRSKHARPLANIPSVRAKYGKEIRGLLTCEDGQELCGSDMSSLEDRIKHHYQWEYDPEYVKTQMADDYDPHLLIAVAAGLITEAQMVNHKLGIENWGAERQIGKGGNYSCQYGAGFETVARTCGVRRHIGRKVHAAYWKLNWSIKEIAKNTTVKKAAGKTWQYNPINGFWYLLKADKDRFSTLAQGSGAYCFDMWIIEMIKLCEKKWNAKLPLVGDFHDEVILRVKKGNQQVISDMMREAMSNVNTQLNLNRELDYDIEPPGS